MKKLIVAATMLAAVVAPATMQAYDPTDYMFVPAVQLNASGTGTVYVWLDTYVKKYNSFQMDIYLPEGFSIEKNTRGKYVFTWNPNEDVVYSHAMSTADHDDAGFVRLVGTSTDADYLGSGKNWIFKFNIEGPADFTGVKDIVINAIKYADDDSNSAHVFDEVTASVIAADATTITISNGPTSKATEIGGTLTDGIYRSEVTLEPGDAITYNYGGNAYVPEYGSFDGLKDKGTVTYPLKSLAATATSPVWEFIKYSTDTKYELNTNGNVTFTWDPLTGVDEITDSADAGDAVYYDLNGIRIEHPTAPGVYILRKGTGVEKILVK